MNEIYNRPRFTLQNRVVIHYIKNGGNLEIIFQKTTASRAATMCEKYERQNLGV